MALSSDLIAQFVKATKDESPSAKESNVYGTIVDYEGAHYIRIDGSERLTPFESTTSVKDGDRVSATIKDHTVMVRGNVTSPSVRSEDYNETVETVANLTSVVADKVSAQELIAITAQIEQLVTEDAVIKGALEASEAIFASLEAKDAEITGLLSANEAEIENIKTNKLDASVADLTFATIESLNATDAIVHNLEASYGDFARLTADELTAINAVIDGIDTKYANIDFSNIGKAAMEHLYAESGLIKDITIDNGTLTGELIGVTIKGDLIEGNTIKADKLVVLGTDGIYYKLNFDGGTFAEGEEVPTDSLHGSVITAKSITATKISVEDLVAFGATIGGFHITESSLYSGVKESVDNTTLGIYLDKNGQIAFGDTDSYVRFYEVSDGEYSLDISASSLYFGIGDSRKNIADVDETSAEAKSKADGNEASILVLDSMMQALIASDTGFSVLTQTEDGWQFGLGDKIKDIETALNGVNDLSGRADNLEDDLATAQESLDALDGLTDYVVITTYNGQPCLELGESDNDFKVRITNTDIQFKDGTSVPAYLSNQKLYIEKAEVTDEMQFGGFVWKTRDNGNMGLIWKGAD